MYSIKECIKNNQKYIQVLQNNHEVALICQSMGASLQRLILDDVPIIDNILDNNELRNSSCSAILFPFVNRIRNGQYTWGGLSYQLPINESKFGNALHGLVYRQAFDLQDVKTGQNTITLCFHYHYRPTVAYPFAFQIQLEYQFSPLQCSLSVHVENKSSKEMPYTLGWHPYFESGGDLSSCHVETAFQSYYTVDEQMIPKNTISFKQNEINNFDSTSYDTCFKIDEAPILFRTPAYRVKLYSADRNDPYVQIYTPDHQQSVAIEPMTGIADAFNNQIGLQTIGPNDKLHKTWIIQRVQ